jgi:uncharacterized protein (DUF433 family)
MSRLNRITFNPKQCGGMRIRVKDVLGMLASGMTETQILTDFPDLEAEDIRASLEYAAESVNHPVLMVGQK